jgi:hypothetical protein
MTPLSHNKQKLADFAENRQQQQDISSLNYLYHQENHDTKVITVQTTKCSSSLLKGAKAVFELLAALSPR